MDLEEHTLERVGERCEECGARLSSDEIAAAIESGGPTLCKIHAAEIVDEPEDAAEPAE